MKKMKLLTILIQGPLLFLTTFRTHALEFFAQPVQSSQNGVGVPSPRSDKFTVILKPYCFGVNLRQQANPLSPVPGVNVKMTLALEGQTVPIVVTFPALFALDQHRMQGSGYGVWDDPSKIQNFINAHQDQLGGSTTPASLLSGRTLQGATGPGTTNAVGTLGAIQVVTDIPNAVSVNDAGDITVAMPKKVKSLKFDQIGASGGEYRGHTGPLSSAHVTAFTNDNKTLEIVAGFPGEEGRCGGFHSPLMMFFSKARPEYKGVSDFPLTVDLPRGRNHAWPEVGAPGYFLVIKNDSENKEQPRWLLIGEQNDAKNGFEILKKIANKKGTITPRDKAFKKLALWSDKNGNGIQEKSEISSLASMGVESISTEAITNEVRPIGDRAEEREKSTFQYRSPAGKLVKGDLIDVWFSNRD